MWSPVGLRESPPPLQVLLNLEVLHALVGLTSTCEDLPQQDSIRPLQQSIKRCLIVMEMEKPDMNGSFSKILNRH